MPAAAVIPAPIAYANTVAVKKLVVGFKVWRLHPARPRPASSGGPATPALPGLGRRIAGPPLPIRDGVLGLGFNWVLDGLHLSYEEQVPRRKPPSLVVEAPHGTNTAGGVPQSFTGLGTCSQSCPCLFPYGVSSIVTVSKSACSKQPACPGGMFKHGMTGDRP